MKKLTARDVHYHNELTIPNMIMKVVYDDKDQNKLIIHLNRDLEAYLSVDDGGWKDFDDFCSDDDFIEPPAFRSHLLKVRGVVIVSFDKYSISILKGEVFEWKRLLVQIRASLELDLNDGDPAEYTEVYSGRRTPVQWLKDLIAPRIKIPLVARPVKVSS